MESLPCAGHVDAFNAQAILYYRYPMIPFLWMRKLSQGKAKQLAHGHATGKLLSWVGLECEASEPGALPSPWF